MLSNFYFGNHCYIKGKSSQHLEMRLYSLELFIPVVQFSLFLHTFFWLQQNHLLCVLICSREKQGKKHFSIMDNLKGPELTASPVMWVKAGHHSNLFLVWRIRRRLCSLLMLHTVRQSQKEMFVKGLCKTGVDELSLQGTTDWVSVVATQFCC